MLFIDFKENESFDRSDNWTGYFFILKTNPLNNEIKKLILDYNVNGFFNKKLILKKVNLEIKLNKIYAFWIVSNLDISEDENINEQQKFFKTWELIYDDKELLDNFHENMDLYNIFYFRYK